LLRTAIVNDPERWRVYNALFDTEVSGTNLEVNFMRSLILGAGPIKDGEKRYSNIKDDLAAQEIIASGVQKNLRSLTTSGDEKYANVRARIWGRIIYNVIFQETVAGDVAYAAFSFLFVFCYIWFHLGSLFITSLSMLMILMSFPISYLLYTGIF